MNKPIEPAQENKQADDKPIEEVKNARLRIKSLVTEFSLELNRSGEYTGFVRILFRLEVENLTDNALALAMPSIKVSGEGVTKGGLVLPKPEWWWYGDKQWDGKLQAKEKKTITLGYLKIDREVVNSFIAGKEVQVEIVFKGGDGDGLKLRTQKTKVGSVKQE